ncbi:phosphatase PAP2 family protein [Paludibacter sp. 221]|uniref:phosphatase PAP2 family protein n=1 Tax=Paludibacter sp. 221 TaxID=2302939 RepID=UPI0013D1A7D1|nr:phosphatase PAP2 family protein [Paludibacter sp. 221]NDV47409.1 phosphatase PAP2 family protein [Paludibacter sp. 221]
MKNLKQYWAFWIPYGVFVVALAVMLILNEKAELHLWLNSVHTPFMDVFFRIITEVGSWVPFVVGAGLLFYKYRAALLVLGAQIAAGVVAQILKRIFDMPRPKSFFAEHFPDITLQQVLDVRMHSAHSFPSGHTTSAFALFLSLAFLTKRKELHFLYVLLAMLTGYSRIYLSQHFASDVLAGSVIGVVMTIVTLYIIDKKPRSWYDRSLLKRA